MKNIARWLILVLALGALGLTGPEPRSSDFDVFVDEVQGLNRIYDRTNFLRSEGWDFGDRAAYACAFVEHYTGSALNFEVHLELFDDYPTPIEVNDRNGREGREGTFDCGDGIGKGANLLYSEEEYGDHFPHGTDLVFSRGTIAVEFARVVYSDGDMCGPAYWTPGNEPGEAVLWWDEDGAQDTMPGMGDCGGGPGEPVAVAVATVQDVAPGVTYCVLDSLDGDMCATG